MNEYELRLLMVYFAVCYNAPYSSDCEECIHLPSDPKSLAVHDALKSDGFVVTDGWGEEDVSASGMKYLELMCKQRFGKKLSECGLELLIHLPETERLKWQESYEAMKVIDEMRKRGELPG